MHLKPIFHKTVLFTRFPYEAILSGEEWHTIMLAESLRERGWRVIFMGSCPVLSVELQKRGFEVHMVWGGTLPVTKWALVLFLIQWPCILYSLMKGLRKIERMHLIDSVYMLSLTEKILLTPWLKYFKKNVLWIEHQRFGKWMYLNPLRFVYTYLSRIVDVVGVSPMHVEQLHRLNIPEEKLHCITNGIDTDFFSPKGEIVRVVEGADYVVGAVARYYEDKGLDLLIRGFEKVKRKYTARNMHLVIQGEGPLEDTLKALVEELGIREHVHFLIPYTVVPREKMPAFYRGLDICVLPSRAQDPFGLVAAEAMACGIPTIVTDVCGISVFLENEEDALIVPAESQQAIADAIEEICIHEEKTRKLKIQARKTATEKFSLERMVNEYERLLEKE